MLNEVRPVLSRVEREELQREILSFGKYIISCSPLQGKLALFHIWYAVGQYEMKLASPSEVDEELLGWLKEAYTLG